MYELIKIRITAFAYEAAGIILASMLGVLASEQFRELISVHWGTGVGVSITFLVLDGVIKHLRNLQIIKKFGATGIREPFI